MEDCIVWGKYLKSTWLHGNQWLRMLISQIEQSPHNYTSHRMILSFPIEYIYIYILYYLNILDIWY